MPVKRPSGFTEQDLNAMLDMSDHLCAICNRADSSCYEHDHVVQCDYLKAMARKAANEIKRLREIVGRVAPTQL